MNNKSPWASRYIFKTWILIAAIVIVLAACNAPDSLIAKRAIVEPPTFTPTFSMPTLIRLATPTKKLIQKPTQSPPTFTPTATPLPFPSSMKSLQLAYSNNGKIELWQEGGTTPLVSYDGDPQYMNYLDVMNTLPVEYSDDGAYVAFMQLDGGIWTIRSNGTGKKNIFDMDVLNNASHVRPYLIGWIPNTHTLLFSTVHWLATSIYALDGSFYVANVDTGEVKHLSVFTNTGVRFFPAPDGKHIAAVKGNEIYIIDTNGNNLRKLFTFPYSKFENIFPDFGFYALPVWAQDSQSFAVVVPPMDPMSPQGLTEIWRIFIDGRVPQCVSRLNAAIFSREGYEMAVWLAPDVTHLAYFKPVNENEKQFELHVASLDLSDDKIVFQDNEERVYWSPDSQRIAFWRSGENPSYSLANIDGSIQPLTKDWARDITWIDPENLLFFRDGEFWLVTTNNEEYLLTKSEFLYQCSIFENLTSA